MRSIYVGILLWSGLRAQVPVSLNNPASLQATAPDTYKARFTTTKGDFVVEVHRAWAPIGADRFYNLVRSGFYSDASFFRVIRGFVVQFGMNANPSINRVWQNAFIKDDRVKESNKRGTLTFAASSAANSRTTQVFINLGDNPQLDASGFAVFGAVVEGMDAVDGLYNGYGEAPNQGLIAAGGKAYLDKKFPQLDSIAAAIIQGQGVAPLAAVNRAQMEKKTAEAVTPSPTNLIRFATPQIDEQTAAIVKDQSGLIKVTKRGGNILEFDLAIGPGYGPVVTIPNPGKFTYHLSKDVQVLKNETVKFTDGPHRAWDMAGTRTLQFRLLEGDAVPASVHLTLTYDVVANIDPSKVKFLATGCGEPRGAVGVVSREIDLSTDETARPILNSGAKYVSEQCPRALAKNMFQVKGGFANIVVELRRGDPTTFADDKFNYKNPMGSSISRMIADAYPERAVWGRNYDETALSWGEYQNTEKERVTREKERVTRERDEALRREAQIARRRAQEQAEEAEGKAAALKTETFFKRAGTKQIANLGVVCQNPFLYVGKVIAFPLTGFWTWSATSATSALLDTFACPFDLTSVPATSLTPNFKGDKVIAVRVLGKPQGKVMQLQYVYHEQCAVYRCSDYSF